MAFDFTTAKPAEDSGGFDFSSATPENPDPITPTVNFLKKKLGSDNERQLNEIVQDVGNKGLSVGSALKGAIGGIETPVALLTGLPEFALDSARGLYKATTSSPEEYEQYKKTKQPILPDLLTGYQPRTDVGQVLTQGISKGFESAVGVAGDTLANAALYASQGAGDFQDPNFDPVAYERSLREKFPEAHQYVKNVSEAGLNLAMAKPAFGMAANAVKGAKDLATRPKPSEVALEEFGQRIQKKPVSPMDSELQQRDLILKDHPEEWDTSQLLDKNRQQAREENNAFFRDQVKETGQGDLLEGLKPYTEAEFLAREQQRQAVPFDGPGFSEGPIERASPQESLATRHDFPTDDFMLRQEVLEQPEIAQAIEAFRGQDIALQNVIDTAKSNKTKEQARAAQAAAREEFQRGMELMGIQKPADAYGRGLYEARGENTTGAIQHTFNPRKQGGFIDHRVFKEGFKKARDLVTDTGFKFRANINGLSKDNAEVRITTPTGMEIGRATLSRHNPYDHYTQQSVKIDFIKINPEYQKRGIGKEVYNTIEREIGDLAQTRGDKTQLGQKLRDAYNRDREGRSPLGGVGKSQGGAINSSVFLEGIEKAIKEIEDRAKKATGHSWKTLPEDKAQKKLLNETRSAIYNRHIDALNKETEAIKDSIKGVSLADNLQKQTEALQEIVKELQKPKLTLISKSQRGSIGWKKETESFSEFYDKAVAKYGKETVDANIDQLKETHKKMFGEQLQARQEVVKSSSQVKAAVDNKALLDTEVMSLDTLAKVIDDIPDIPDSAVGRMLTSGGRMYALRTGNPLVAWGVEKIYMPLRRAEVVAKNAVQGLLTSKRTLEKNMGKEGFLKLMQEMTAKIGKKEPLALDNPFARDLAGKFRDALDQLHKDVSEVTGKPVRYLPNYLGGIFSGKYRSLVKDAKGNVIGVIAGKTMKEAQAALEFFKKEFDGKGASFDPIKFSDMFDSGKTQKTLGASYVHFNEMAQIFGDTDLGRVFQERAEQYYANQAYAALSYREHFKARKGVAGAEGQKPWKDAVENAEDMFNAQIKLLEDGNKWVAQQKATKSFNEMNLDPRFDKQQNSKLYLAQYLDHAYNTGPREISRAVTNWLAKGLGISPDVFGEVGSVARNFALVNTIGLSGGFALSQVVQIPTALATTKAFLSKLGISLPNTASNSLIAINDWMNSTRKDAGSHYVSKEGAYFYDYAIKNGVADPHLLEHQPTHHLITTTGMGKFQKYLIDWSINKPFYAVEKYNKTIGDLSIGKLEGFTRGTYFLTVAHSLKQAGYSLKDAASMADKLTSDFFVDYNPAETPILWSRLGAVGPWAKTVSQFKMNSLNQMATFKSNKAAAAVLATLGMTFALSGLSGIVGFDEANTITQALKSMGLVENNLSETLSMNVPTHVQYGVLSTVTNTGLYQKFSQANVLPDSPKEAFFPLLRYYTNAVEAAVKAFKNPVRTNVARVAWEVAPPAGKALIEKTNFVTPEGMSVNPRNVTQGISQRSLPDWQKKVMGFGVLKEDIQRDISFNQKLDKMTLADKKKSALEQMSVSLMNKDMPKVQAYVEKYLKLGGDPEALKRTIREAELDSHTSLEVKNILDSTKGRGMDRARAIQRVQQMERNSKE